MTAQEFQQAIGRQRAADQVALQFVALEQGEEFCLLLFLDPLGDDLEIEGVRHSDHGRHDRHADRAGRHRADEGLVNFQRVDRQPR